jgi:enamine deaminase RidA (YjgF/YER057c/UK114 family)
VLQAAAEASAGRTIHFRRFFLSDAANQASLLKAALQQLPPVPTSVVQQEPLDGTRIALWMYGTDASEVSGGIPRHNGYSHHWSGSLVSPGADSYAQMAGIFQDYGKALAAKDLAMDSDTIRTWIFVRDVDCNYAGVVKGRKEYFDRIGLTADTHYIASTGIEGRAPEHQDLVEMDAYSIGGLDKGQLGYLHAASHLSPTALYGVTFERGATVSYGDRKQIYISGTASIDAAGKTLFEGDVCRQAGRMLENIAALLSEAGASMADIAMAIVYLRDPADYVQARQFISEHCPDLNVLYVLGPVCRPAWLVEMECIALTPAGDPAFRPF